MTKKGFYVDTTRCIGCRACDVQCKDKNRLGTGVDYRKTLSYCVGSYPDVQCFHMSTSCNHCEDAACLRVCPVGAIVEQDGVVLCKEDTCIGCKRCVKACPYGQMKVIANSRKVGKCDSCYTIRQEGGIPACVAACPMRALDFGDLDILEKKYGSHLVNHLPVLGEIGSTKPALRIKAKTCALSEEAKEMWL
ncbi:MAG: 4Fe-4S dicluster domain-containing protein [Cellulosilyticaceae bacterium]